MWCFLTGPSGVGNCFFWLICSIFFSIVGRFHVWQTNTRLKGRLVFWRGHLRNIWVLEPNFMKSENRLLMWKVIYFPCTPSRLHILCRDCPGSSDFPKLSFLFFFFFLHYPSSASPSLPNETGQHFVSVITGRHYSLLSAFSHSTQISTTLHLLFVCLQYSKPTWNPGVFGYLDNVECHPKPFRGLRFFWDFLILFFQVFSAMAFSGFWVWL